MSGSRFQGRWVCKKLGESRRATVAGQSGRQRMRQKRRPSQRIRVGGVQGEDGDTSRVQRLHKYKGGNL